MRTNTVLDHIARCRAASAGKPIKTVWTADGTFVFPARTKSEARARWKAFTGKPIPKGTKFRRVK